MTPTVCEPGAPLEVDDTDPCTADTCDPVSGVSHTLTPGASRPDPDGDPCTGQGVCDALGACAGGCGSPAECNPQGPQRPPYDPRDPSCEGSVLECRNQILREAAPVAGTPYSLHYSSGSAAGRVRPELRVTLPLTPAVVPAPLLGVHAREKAPSPNEISDLLVRADGSVVVATRGTLGNDYIYEDRRDGTRVTLLGSRVRRVDPSGNIASVAGQSSAFGVPALPGPAGRVFFGPSRTWPSPGPARCSSRTTSRASAASCASTRADKRAPSPETAPTPRPTASSQSTPDSTASRRCRSGPTARSTSCPARVRAYLETRDALRNIVTLTIARDTEGRIESLTDQHGLTTTILRSANDDPVAIVGPFGHTTALTVDADGYLETIEDPTGAAFHITYEPPGPTGTATPPPSPGTPTAASSPTTTPKAASRSSARSRPPAATRSCARRRSAA